MTKTFPEVISGIRTAKKGVEVREDIAQMGEYVEQFAQTATEKAAAAAASEEKASDAVKNIDQQTEDAVTEITTAESKALTELEEKRASALQEMQASVDAAAGSAEKSATSEGNAKASEEASEASEEASAKSEAAAKASQEAAATSEANALKYSQEAGAKAGTDKTLSIEDAPADAKKTGEELTLRYTKEQVDALLAQYKADTLLAAYPVGSLYMSADATSPAEIFGGTWEQIKDRFILAAGDTYAAGSTGGEEEVSLTEANNGPHLHSAQVANYSTGNLYVPDNQWRLVYKDPGASTGYLMESSGFVGKSGKGQPHNNMPPYITKYVWQRIE